MAVDDLFTMEHWEQDDNNEINYHPKNANSSFWEQQYACPHICSTPEEWGNTLEEFVFWDLGSIHSYYGITCDKKFGDYFLRQNLWQHN